MKIKVLETNKQIKGEFINGSINGKEFELEIGTEVEVDEELARVIKDAGYEIEEVKEIVE